MQFLGIGSVAALVGVAGVGFASTLRTKGSDVTTTSEGNVTLGERKSANRSKASAPAPVATPPVVAPVVQQSTPAVVDSAPAAAPVALSRAKTRAGFVLVEGRTTLTDSIYAIRAGDSVVVSLDSQGNRTRRSDKIENSLRLTLPMILGKMATAYMDTLKVGALVTNRDVVGALATQGMELTLTNGAMVHVRILTRDVTGGPIAVGYVASIR